MLRLLQTNSSFSLRFVFLSQICQNSEAKTEIGPPSTDRAVFSDKARSFNQSERALYRNFIINGIKISASFLYSKIRHFNTCHLRLEIWRHTGRSFLLAYYIIQPCMCKRPGRVSLRDLT